MSKVTISKKEYNELLDKKMRYEYLQYVLTNDYFSPPPTKKRDEVLKALKEDGKYNAAFLKSVEQGLGRSSHFK